MGTNPPESTVTRPVSTIPNNGIFLEEDDPFASSEKRTTGQVICSVATDILIVTFLLILNGILYHHLLKTTQRGFFCNDTSIRYPFHGSTISWWPLVFIGVAVNVTVIVVTEIINHSVYGVPRSRYFILNWQIPQWVVEVYKYCGVFVYGIAAQFLIGCIIKKTAGRLRPHFMIVCEPQAEEGINCTASESFFTYIERFQCKSEKFNKATIAEARMSFPSGHTTYGAYVFFFCALYLHCRLHVRESYMIRPGLQIILICVSLYIGVSRIMDNKHHWADVNVGFAIGIGTALAAILIADRLLRPSVRFTRYATQLRREFKQ